MQRCTTGVQPKSAVHKLVRRQSLLSVSTRHTRRPSWTFSFVSGLGSGCTGKSSVPLLWYGIGTAWFSTLLWTGKEWEGRGRGVGGTWEGRGGDVSHLPPAIPLNQDLLTYTNVSHVLDWAAQRSPLHWVDNINRNRPAVMLSNNFEDRLFFPDLALRLFDALEVLNVALFALWRPQVVIGRGLGKASRM